MSKYKAMKIIVEDTNHGKTVQEELFKLGYSWCSSGNKPIVLAAGTHILTTCGGVMSYSIADAASHYDEYILSETNEFTFLKEGRWSIR